MENEPHKKTVIIVHTIGKVASSSIYLSAKAFCKNAKVYHTHFLSEKKLSTVAAKLKKHGKTLSGHIKDSYDILTFFTDTSINFKIITLVRDPIARDISAFFESSEFFGLDKKNLPPVEEACKIFIKKFPSNLLNSWFIDEFCSVFDINLTAHFFPKRLGWYCFENKNFDFLLLRAELNDQKKQLIVGAFLDCPDLRIGTKNVMSDKFDPEYYSNFKRCLTGQLGKKINCYDTEIINFFYSQEEINAFRSEWDPKVSLKI